MSRSKSKFHKRYSDSGRLIFTKTQTDNRFALCKAALIPTRGHSIRFKKIYDSIEEIEKFCLLDFNQNVFTKNLLKISQIAWGGEFEKYDADYSPEGAFYPFVRFTGRSFTPVDTGAIWIGARDCYPRIFVDNGVADCWVEPYSRSGLVMTEPFQTFPDVSKNLNRLSNRAIYPMLDIEEAF